MPLIQVPPIDYTSRAFEEIRSDMIRAIPLYTPEWTDHSQADPGIALLSILAGHLDCLHFYVDRAAGEAFLPTAIKRESVVKILKLINYELRSVVPASVDVKFTLAQTLPNDVLIPAGTKVQTIAFEQAAPVVFETLSDVTILAGGLEATVSVREGESGTEDLGTSSGQAFQEFPVDAVTIVEGEFDVFVDEGAGYTLWTRVDTFVNSGPADTHYRIERDADERITVFFGDNLQGKVPTPTAQIRADFVTVQGDRGGTGVFGNVGAGTISIVQDTIFAAGTRVTLAVTNPLQAAGGEDVQSIDEAKRLGPASLRALNRAVTAEDYKTLVEQQGGISKARAIQGTSEDPCCACNLDVYVAPTGGGTLSTAAKDALVAFLDTKKMVGTCIEIKDPTYVAVDVEGAVFILSTADPTTVQANVQQAIDDFFDLEGLFADFGGDLYLGNLFAVLENIDGVDHVDLDKVSRVPVPVWEIQTGDSTFGPVTVGPTQSQDEEWTVVFISPTTFTVQGSVSGLQANTGTVGVPYVSDTGQVAFSITAQTTPEDVGDQAQFRTSPYLGNVPIDPTEIMQEGTTDLTFPIVVSTNPGVTC